MSSADGANGSEQWAIARQHLSALYRNRFGAHERSQRRDLWAVLHQDFFSRYVRPADAVLDLGAGLCDWINQVRCAQRFALDADPNVVHHAGPGVKAVVAGGERLTDLGLPPLDVVFASNVFEHMDSKDQLLETARQVFAALKPGGRLLIMQPNLRYVGGEYWDFLDHSIPLTHCSMSELLLLTGFELEEVRPRFLPYTTKSRLPQHPALVRLYLKLPLAHRLLGKQMFIVARRPGPPRA